MAISTEEYYDNGKFKIELTSDGSAHDIKLTEYSSYREPSQIVFKCNSLEAQKLKAHMLRACIMC